MLVPAPAHGARQRQLAGACGGTERGLEYRRRYQAQRRIAGPPQQRQRSCSAAERPRPGCPAPTVGPKHQVELGAGLDHRMLVRLQAGQKGVPTDTRQLGRKPAQDGSRPQSPGGNRWQPSSCSAWVSSNHAPAAALWTLQPTTAAAHHEILDLNAHDGAAGVVAASRRGSSTGVDGGVANP